MHLKDYYSILELEPSATKEEIKKAYRKLALQYHPDKNNNNPYATAQFTEIKEAYEVLTNPSKKQYYLQQRWYNQSMGKRKTQSVLTPVTVLKQVLELDKYVYSLDVHRMDKEGLYSYICDIINDDTISTLNTFNDAEINKEIIMGIISTASELPLHRAEDLKIRLLKINSDKDCTKAINAMVEKIYKSQRWEKYRVVVVLLAALLISLLIFFLSR